MIKKIKVAWLCHLRNNVLNNHFGIEKNMTAYWMTQFIDMMKNHVEIHVVAPNYYTNQDTCFQIDGVYYHLYKYYSGMGDTKAALVEIALRREKNIPKKVCRIIDGIKPDILHLFGAENITYSSGILPFIGKLPTITSFQGYIQLAECKGNTLRKMVIRRRVKTEDEIFRLCPNVSFGTFEKSSESYYIEKYNVGKIYPINFPFKLPQIDASIVKKEYDIVFWGRVTYEKGVEDLIQAVKKVKDKMPNIKCLILGGGSAEYLLHLNEMVENNDLASNIIFGGFQKTDQQLFENAAKAKIYVLPTHFDALPGSIRESMAMKLPVVTYDVGDIPLLNENVECVKLVKALNIEELSDRIIELLTDDNLRCILSDNSYKEIQKTSSDDFIVKQIISCYDTLLS